MGYNVDCGKENDVENCLVVVDNWVVVVFHPVSKQLSL